MRAQSKLLYLAFCRASLLFFTPIVFVYVIIPMIVIATYTEGLEVCKNNFIFGIHIFVPLGVVMWVMSYLQIWLDSEGQEAMWVCRGKRRTSACEILLLQLGYVIMLIPGGICSVNLFGFLWREYICLLIEIFFMVSLVYMFSNMLASVTMGGMLTILYVMFCIFFAGDASMNRYVVININEVAGVDSFWMRYFVICGISVTMFVLGDLFDRMPYFKRW